MVEPKKEEPAPEEPEVLEDPQGCEPEQYWAAEPPHNCIDKPSRAPVSTQTTKTAISGTKEDWMRQAGIPESQWQYVDYIVSRESGWNPCAYYPGQSNCDANPTSACGLAQSLPCGKQSKYGHWTDPVANLKWQYEYVTARYGGYQQAVAFWRVNHWY